MLVDDGALFREGLAGLLATRTDVDVAAQASSVDEAYARLARTPVDVVVLDIRMPPTYTDEGMRAARELRRPHPDLGILMLTAHAELASATRLLDDLDHSAGYLVKDRVEDVVGLARDLRRIAAGELVLDPEVVTDGFRHRRTVRRLAGLTARERQVLELMAAGWSNAGIATTLTVAEKTVETHIAAVYQKLCLPASPDNHRRVHAVLAWMTARGA